MLKTGRGKSVLFVLLRSSNADCDLCVASSRLTFSCCCAADEITLRLVVWMDAGRRDGLESDLGRIVGFFIRSRRGLITGCGATPRISILLFLIGSPASAHYAPNRLMRKRYTLVQCVDTKNGRERLEVEVSVLEKQETISNTSYKNVKILTWWFREEYNNFRLLMVLFLLNWTHFFLIQRLFHTL